MTFKVFNLGSELPYLNRAYVVLLQQELPPLYSGVRLTVHFKRNYCQKIPHVTLNTFYILVIHTDNAHISFELIALCQPGGAAINFSKSP